MACLVALLAAAGCSTSSNAAPKEDGGGGADGDDGSFSGDSGQDVDTCMHAEPPAPPASDSPTGQNVEFLVALHDATFTNSPDGGTILGFDLDHTCSCPAPETCTSPTMKMQCDDANGRDVAGDVPLGTLETVLTTTTQGDLNKRIADGTVSLVFDVTNYNTGQDDTQVGVAVLVSSGIIVTVDGGTASVPPKWDGNDAWNIDPRSVSGSMQTASGWLYTPLFVSTTAYVTGGVLVAQLPMMQFGIGVGSLELDGVVLEATIAPDPNGGYRFSSGQFAARVPLASVFAVLATVKDPFDKTKFLCGGDATFLQYKPSICNAADIMSSASNDNTGSTCDSMGIALGITAQPAKLGGPNAPSAQPVGCDGGVDTCP